MKAINKCFPVLGMRSEGGFSFESVDETLKCNHLLINENFGAMLSCDKFWIHEWNPKCDGGRLLTMNGAILCSSFLCVFSNIFPSGSDFVKCGTKICIVALYGLSWGEKFSEDWWLKSVLTKVETEKVNAETPVIYLHSMPPITKLFITGSSKSDLHWPALAVLSIIFL